MRFEESVLPGAYLVWPERRDDLRGFFARTYCEREFAERGLIGRVAQCSVAFNSRRGTLRGLHFQRPPAEEAKLVRCTSGAVYDVIVDLRRGSPTFCRWAAYELTEQNRVALYIPPGLAHGYQTLTDDTEVLYQMSDFYAPELAGGVRWNDPAFAIRWPIAEPILSEKDRGYADFVR